MTVNVTCHWLTALIVHGEVTTIYGSFSDLKAQRKLTLLVHPVDALLPRFKSEFFTLSIIVSSFDFWNDRM